MSSASAQGVGDPLQAKTEVRGLSVGGDLQCALICPATKVLFLDVACPVPEEG